jgi:hypothetical protein
MSENTSNRRTTQTVANVRTLLDEPSVRTEAAFLLPDVFVAAGVPKSLAPEYAKQTKGEMTAEDVETLLEDLGDDLDATFAANSERDPHKLADSVQRTA